MIFSIETLPETYDIPIYTFAAGTSILEKPMKILIIKDDASLTKLLTYGLEASARIRSVACQTSERGSSPLLEFGDIRFSEKDSRLIHWDNTISCHLKTAESVSLE